MGSAENFKLVKELADALGGVVGATRPAIEDGWISRVHQVGQSGKNVAQKLYIHVVYLEQHNILQECQVLTILLQLIKMKMHQSLILLM